MEVRILKYLPFAGGLLVFLGVLKITIYYQYFGISILPYLSMSDVLLLFLNDLNSLLVLAIIGTVHIMTSGEILESLGSRLDYVVLKLRWYYIGFFGVSCSIISVLLGLNTIDLEIWNIYLTIFLAIQFLTFTFMKKSINEETSEIEVDFRVHKLLMLLITIVATGMMPLLAIKNVQEIKGGNEKVVLYINDGKEMSNSQTIYYLGKAGEYHFFYDRMKKKSTTVRNSDVKRIEKQNP